MCYGSIDWAFGKNIDIKCNEILIGPFQWQNQKLYETNLGVYSAGSEYSCNGPVALGKSRRKWSVKKGNQTGK